MCIRSSRMSIMRVIWLNTRTRWPAAFSRVSSLSKRIICRAIGRSCKVPHAQRQKSGRKIERWECQTSSDIPSALQKHAGVKSQCLASPTHAFTENQSRRPACSLQPASRFIRELLSDLESARNAATQQNKKQKTAPSLPAKFHLICYQEINIALRATLQYSQ